VYVKTGQFAAAFASVPPEFRKHLALLQDKAKPRPFAAVERVIRAELGAPPEAVFAEFHAEATAAASLAQVGGG
jgi:ubiquinone biosynthesis protein